ncbi:HVA22-like protein k [Stylosanthes scabra]|uniref:HVA22-like protein n=1 Tax=Stylosanthes scabra TaxID=79078 RepID=A0ABU6Y2G4_9FABA|nr:HVA22-like protein k [Stylosanthes scabra]
MDLHTQVVGLAQLLCPLNSNIVLKTACCSIGLVIPVYSTFKAIESKDQDDQHKWLLYWAAYGSFSVAEMFAEKLLSWFPLYYHMKFAFLVWLQLPPLNGAKQLYADHLRPFLLKHQARLDQVVNLAYGEMSKFVSAHQVEFQLARSLLMNILMTANQMFRSVILPARREPKRIAGPRRPPVQDSESDDE